MKKSLLNDDLYLRVTTWLVAVILVAMPFHAFLTVWISRLVGQYTLLRLWKEIVLIILCLATCYLLIVDQQVRSKLLKRRLVWLVLAYIILQVICGAAAYLQHRVTVKALGYGLIVDTRYLLFFLVVWAVTIKNNFLYSHWRRLLFWPALVVVIFAVLQITVLPSTFLEHFGYGPRTIDSFQMINGNKDYVRIESTLRGVNPLGAYMVLIISCLVAVLNRRKLTWLKIAFYVGAVVTLIFTFSRSAWVGTIIAVLIVAKLKVRKLNVPSRALYIGGATILIVVVVSGLELKNNARFQNIFFHTQTHTAAPISSNAGHLRSVEAGLHDIEHQPLGAGPGTAGPASFYNNHPVRISENYFIQVGQEAGWLGLVLFLLINVGVGYILWLRRDDPLALALFASLIGLSIVNLLLHAWADDTLAYIWWGLAGLAVASTQPGILELRHKHEATKKTDQRD